MCGIVGIYSYGWPGDVSESVVRTMRDQMVHRGPDDAGSWIAPDRRVGLGHRRLSIVDLSSAGRQPMTNETESLRIVFNGEVYNHAELRSGLELKGHQYRSRTDTETLLHLYEEHGPEMLGHLRGMFAFAIWDQDRRRLFLARDRVGIKPLYFSQQGGRILFASEIKALLAHPSMSPDLDTTALYHYLTYYTAPAPNTLFSGIHKLPAGHAMTITSEGDRRIWRWWDAGVGGGALSGQDVDEVEAASRVKDLLESAVEERLMADVPFGVMLSGGLDSSSIAALVQNRIPGNVRTFSVGYTNAPDHDETSEARYVANHLGTDHHEVLIDQKEFVDYVPHLIHAQDEPLADWVCIPLHYVSKLVRDSGTIVALVGEGSDEQFAGYRHYLRYVELERSAWRWYGRLPQAVRRVAAKGLDPVLRRSGLPREIRELVRRAGAGESLFLSGAVAAWESDKRDMASREMLRDGWADLSSVPIAEEAMERFMVARPEATFLARMIYQEFQLRLPELLLMRVDKITMSNSIEARVPFLDHRLVEYTFGLPDHLKLHNGTTKHVLKEAVRGLIPDRIIDRPKQGFSAPVKEWFRGDLADYARRTILESRLMDRGILDKGELSRMLEAHRTGRRNYDTLLWSLVNLSQWYDRWIAPDPGRAATLI